MTYRISHASKTSRTWRRVSLREAPRRPCAFFLIDRVIVLVIGLASEQDSPEFEYADENLDTNWSGFAFHACPKE